MVIDDRIFILTDILLEKCVENTVTYHVNKEQETRYNDEVDDVYCLSAGSPNDNDIFKYNNEICITFCFDKNPFISLSLSNQYGKKVTSFDSSRIIKLEPLVEKIYNEACNRYFDDILKEAITLFDIDESELRDKKIKFLIDE